MPPFSKMTNDTVFIAKPDGERLGPYKSSLSANSCTIFDKTLDVDHGDKVIRPLPNKLIEIRDVEEKRTQPLGFTAGFEEDSLTRFDAKAQVRKKKKKSRYKGNQNQRNE